MPKLNINDHSDKLPEWAFKLANTFHQLILKLSGGKIGGTLGKMQVLELTTIGRKTKEPRTVLLTSPLSINDSIVIVASKGGNEHNPAWFLNLKADPTVSVKLPNESFAKKYKARIASDQQRSELWPKIVKSYRGYGEYQKKTSRTIPVVYLDPA